MILGHGLGAVREMRLDAYAERFAAAGEATYRVHLYRYFGDPGGEPRQLLDIRRQLDDWRAALRPARTLGGIRQQTIALWGSSFAGGHVLELGASEAVDGRGDRTGARSPTGWPRCAPPTRRSPRG